MNRIAALAALALPLAACTAEPEPAAAEAAPQDAFWQALSGHCGKAYAGRMTSDEEADAEMRGAEMAMHVRECSDERIAIPFHVRNADGSWDRSRTWLITRTAEGLRLKHDHRYEDGSEDAVTMYGGDTAGDGTAQAQDFPVDAESVALFEREGLGVSTTNVWQVAVDPADAEAPVFAYRLMRAPPNARNFRVEFDLSRPIDPPPAPWGHGEAGT
ncbi:hypothetical protein [Pelagerythrobacter sp.]|uniref:hypothetical protein n=1 Tax=Pelagerythrobacter sp. TaxID=2800702 RepID=UPI0035B43E6D